MVSRASQVGLYIAPDQNRGREQELDILANDGRSSGTQAIDREYVPPDSGYGWVCVVCVFMVNAHTWGLNFVSDTLHSSTH